MKPTKQQKIIAKKLLDYGKKLRQGENWVGPTDFTYKCPFAFLLGVIFDQGITAEKAWDAPEILKKRLGTLDPVKIEKMNLRKIRKAIKGERKGEALHRYINKMARWIKDAARIVSNEYSGNAKNIWEEAYTAREVMARLEEFPGISQKKATMATRILEDIHKLDLSYWKDVDVSYDIHVRRVLWRTGIATNDSYEEVINAARALNPSYPGELDEPAWVIGREWCDSRHPICDEDNEYNPCPLSKVCPRFTRRKPDYQ